MNWSVLRQSLEAERDKIDRVLSTLSCVADGNVVAAPDGLDTAHAEHVKAHVALLANTNGAKRGRPRVKEEKRTTRKQQVLNFLAENGPSTSRDIAWSIGILETNACILARSLGRKLRRTKDPRSKGFIYSVRP